MAHFAKLDSNNLVTQVIVVNNSDITDSNGDEIESIGVAFCQKLLGADTNWKQTSYNNNFRGNYAGIGMTYDDDNDIFIDKKPHNSWVLNTSEARWQSPVGDEPALTEDEELTHYYEWNESSGAWDKKAR